MRSLAASVAWILGGLAAGAALFWAFLNMPESTIVTLSASLLLVLAMYAAETGELTAWRPPVARTVVALLPALAVVLTGWWLVGRAQDWMAAYSGEISGWFIATLNWADIRPLLTGLFIAGDWLRFLVVPFLALVWLARVLARGWRPIVDRTTVAHALSPWRLALVTAVAALTLWVPMTYATYWRPRGLPPPPPFWIEPAFAIVKFTVMALVAAVGLGVIARLAAPRPTSPQTISSQR